MVSTKLLGSGPQLFDIRNYGAVAGEDCSDALLIANDLASRVSTPSMKFQSSSGTYQGGAVANGGGFIFVPPGEWWWRNLALEHRVGLIGTGRGSIGKQIPGATGPFVRNRYDNLVHAKYCTVRDMMLHGDRFAPANGGSSTTRVGLVIEGNASNNFNDTRDEDYDAMCVVDNVFVQLFAGDGVRFEGAGANQVGFLKIRSVGGVGLYSFQDNSFTLLDIGHTGKQGVLADGEKCVFGTVQAWYAGEADATQGQGFKATADSGGLGMLFAQDNKAEGLLLDGAHRWIASVNCDRNSKDNDGTYAGVNIFNSTYNNIRGVVGNSFRSNGTFGPTRHALQIGSGNTVGNTVDLTAAKIITGTQGWGVQNDLKAGSVTAGNFVRINGTVY